MKRLQTCCCCASTKTGTITIAVLGIILSILTIIALWVFKHLIVFSTLFFDSHEIPRIIVTINLVFTILICSLLIIAVKKRRSWLMLPFVVLGVVLAIGLLISVLHSAINLYIHDGPEDYTLIATCILVFGLIYLFIYLYLWTVVFSHYLDVRDDEERGRYRKAPYRR